MSTALIYWILMLVWFVFGLAASWPVFSDPSKRSAAASELFLFILLVLIGWKVFGPPVHG